MMSLALDSGTSNRIERSGFGAHACMGIFNSPDSGRFSGADRRFNEDDDGDSCSSSSIGRNSDDSDGGGGGADDGDSNEVESSLNSLNAIEEVLPIKRGISAFYAGKSKSYTSLADAETCSSIKEIVKPEDAYTRKRKNMLAQSILWDKNRNYTAKSSSGGVSKRLASSKSSVALSLTMRSHEGMDSGGSSNSNSASSSPCFSLPPLPPNRRILSNHESPDSPSRRTFSPWRSLSLSDLQHAAAAAASPPIMGSVINERDEEEDEVGDESD